MGSQEPCPSENNTYTTWFIHLSFFSIRAIYLPFKFNLSSSNYFVLSSNSVSSRSVLNVTLSLKVLILFFPAQVSMYPAQLIIFLGDLSLFLTNAIPLTLKKIIFLFFRHFDIFYVGSQFFKLSINQTPSHFLTVKSSTLLNKSNFFWDASPQII